MMHPATELRFVSEEIGFGVFATAPIPCGTILYAKDALEIEIPPGSPLLHSSAYRDTIEKYSFIEPDGTRVISWDIGRFVNHCCQSNSICTGYGFEIATRDIAAGEQITDEYGLFNLTYEMCLRCDKPGCRGVLRPDDLERYYEVWDERIIGALARLREVPQPLLPFIDDGTMAEVDHYLDTGTGYRSTLSLRYRPMQNRMHSL